MLVHVSRLIIVFLHRFTFLQIFTSVYFQFYHLPSWFLSSAVWIFRYFFLPFFSAWWFHWSPSSFALAYLTSLSLMFGFTTHWFYQYISSNTFLCHIKRTLTSFTVILSTWMQFTSDVCQYSFCLCICHRATSVTELCPMTLKKPKLFVFVYKRQSQFVL